MKSSPNWKPASHSLDHDLQPAQAQVAAEGALAKLDVAAGRVVQPPGAAQVGRLHPLGRLIQRAFDLQTWLF